MKLRLHRDCKLFNRSQFRFQQFHKLVTSKTYMTTTCYSRTSEPSFCTSQTSSDPLFSRLPLLIWITTYESLCSLRKMVAWYDVQVDICQMHSKIQFVRTWTSWSLLVHLELFNLPSLKQQGLPIYGISIDSKQLLQLNTMICRFPTASYAK